MGRVTALRVMPEDRASAMEVTNPSSKRRANPQQFFRLLLHRLCAVEMGFANAATAFVTTSISTTIVNVLQLAVRQTKMEFVEERIKASAKIATVTRNVSA